MQGLSRRAFLQVTAGGAGAVAAALGLRQAGRLIPYVVPPEEIKPGQWAIFATVCRECPAGCGMHVRHRDGRTLKAEGNPQHPVNRGTLCARGQSAVQGLYDPDRLRQPLRRIRRQGPLEPATWATAVETITERLRKPGRNVHLFSDVQTGALAEVFTAFAARFGPGSAPRYVEPYNYEPLRDAHRALLGLDTIPRFRLDRSRFVLSLGVDFLESWLSPVEFAQGLSAMRQTRPVIHGRDPYGTHNAGETPAPREAPATREHFHLWLWPSVFLFDGRSANRTWLQEAPDPTSQSTWSSWADMHPDRAAALGLRDGDTIRVQPLDTTAAADAAVTLPVRITADVTPDTLAVVLGQGHQAMGDTARNVGANAFLLRPIQPTQNNFLAARVHRDTSGDIGQRSRHPTSTMQDQHRRELLQWAPLAQALAAPGPAHGEPLRMPLPEGFRTDAYAPHEHTKHRWAMVIDLQRCIGCGACAVACYAENNIPVVGPAEVDRGREMAWLKIIPYRRQHDGAGLGFLPMLCQHCDAAPCEPVCPVYASMHTEEGLNAQIYNRCIGTRYCNNNCPYKARRFNWFDRDWPPSSRGQLNPEVTVRERGVMEKCTFCIQRIRQAQHRALREGRPLRDGEVQPACVATCPTTAMVFGDLLRDDSLVTRMFRHDPRRYQVLGDLNTKPAIAYLRRVA